MLTVRQDRPTLWRFSLAAAAIALGGVLFAQFAALPAVASSTTQTNNFQGINWADPRDNFANDAVVPTGLSTSDSYATTYAKATSILSSFQQNTGANTVRLPINPYSVGNAWWDSYTGAIDAASALGFKVILSYWEGTGSAADGKADDLDSFWPMWTTVTGRYASNDNVYFDPMNEPHGYSLTEWSDLAAKWLSTYASVPRDRIFVAGTGYDDDVKGVCADSRLDGTYLALHDYAFWATKTYAGWVDDITGRIGSCAGRTVLEEFGVPMTTGLNYDGSSTEGSADANNYIAYLQAMTDVLRAQNMGSVYWPGLRQDDSYSLTQLQGSGTDLSLSVNNYSGLDRLRWGWGNGSTPTSTPTTTPLSGGCSAALTVASVWDGGFQVAVTVTAGSSAISKWSTSLSLPAGSSIGNLWSGTLSGSASPYTVTDAGYNGAVAAGQSTSYGFTGTGSAPSNATLPCSAS